MNPAMWGPSAWCLLHGLVARLPGPAGRALAGAECDVVVTFVRATARVMPCVHCRTSLHGFLDARLRGAPMRAALRSPGAAQALLCGVHNDVRAKLGRAPASPREAAAACACARFDDAALARAARVLAAAAGDVVARAAPPLDGREDDWRFWLDDALPRMAALAGVRAALLPPRAGRGPAAYLDEVLLPRDPALHAQWRVYLAQMRAIAPCERRPHGTTCQ